MVRAREDCVQRFGSIFSLPVLSGNPLDMLSTHVSLLEGRMLDYGAGPQGLRSFMTSRFPRIEYTSLDSDGAYGCDWLHIKDIPNEVSFSLICANQVLEHIPLEGSLQLIEGLSKKLEPGGIFYATVPNTFHPNRFRGDVDHCTYVTYTVLYYLCFAAGLQTLALYRYSKRHPQGWFERFLTKKIQDIYRMDWADSVCIIAQKT